MTKQVKIFGAHQRVKHPDLVEIFLKQIIKNPPKTGKILEKQKCDFSVTHKIDLIQNRDLVVIARAKEYKLPPELEQLIQKLSLIHI